METLAISPESYQMILEGIADGVYIVDFGRRILFWNTAAADITGYSADEIVERCCPDNILKHVDCQGVNLCQNNCPLMKSLLEGVSARAEVYLHHKDGHRVPVEVSTAPVRDEAGTIVAAVEIFHKNSEVVRMRNRLSSLKEMALKDSLTGIANRRYLEMHLMAFLKDLRDGGEQFSVLMIDIDHFKQINDCFGHERGDQVLRMVASTLVHAAPAVELVGRWGGEEFVAMLPTADPKAIARTAELMRIMVARSALPAQPSDIHATISIGATVARSSDSIQTLLRRADACMYTSKIEGRNRVTLDEGIPAV